MATNRDKLEKLKTTINIYKDGGYENVKRASFIATAISEGLVEKDTYIVLKDHTKAHGHRGWYKVDRIIAELRRHMGKTVHIKNRPATEKSVAGKLYKGERAFENEAWGSIPYSSDDIAEELSLMGTTI